jgi:hypothetical protein
VPNAFHRMCDAKAVRAPSRVLRLTADSLS